MLMSSILNTSVALGGIRGGRPLTPYASIGAIVTFAHQVKALDDVAHADAKLERSSSFPRVLKNLAGFLKHADVVNACVLANVWKIEVVASEEDLVDQAVDRRPSRGFHGVELCLMLAIRGFVFLLLPSSFFFLFAVSLALGLETLLLGDHVGVPPFVQLGL
uniref:Uncharacterized protein n=1 Tax=Globisporangium ultimum (strain ATCC 200006 / CBS 805.95 / DAOM BR144) TaxID=431595 RepID=K3XC17_GLOUD